MAEDGKTLKFRQSKSNNSTITNDTRILLHVHNLIMVYIFSINFMLFQPIIGYIDMAEARKMIEI